MITPSHGNLLTDGAVVTWQAEDPDGDSLLFDLLYSPDHGQSWLPLATRLSTDRIPASNAALIQVLATDGLHTVAAQSGLFAVIP